MELNIKHREYLINLLTESREAERSIRQKEKDQDMLDRSDIRMFLLLERISLIEKGLIDNEIDY